MSQYVFKLPDLGEGTVESEIGEWFVKVGDTVNEEDIVGTMMTDKAAVEVSSPVSGKVLKLAGEPGDIIAVGSPLVVFETEAETEEAESTARAGAPRGRDPEGTEQERNHTTEIRRQTQSGGGNAKDERPRVKTSPAIRRRAKEAGIDLFDVPGTGPGGRVTREDFDNYAEASTDAGHAPGQEPSRRAPAASRPRTEEIKIIGLRRIIAERMQDATREIPHFTYVEEVDVTELEALRGHLNDDRPKDRERLTLLPFLGMALVRALREFPQCNATFDKRRNLVIRHGPVHLGIATQTGDGLKVPVIRDADTLSLDELAREIRQVSAAARDNSIRREALTGSTITITSLGKLGGIVSTPVINQPEVAIIGVNRAVERPVVIGGQVAVRLMMNLSSSFDHRFVDGYDAAAMIQRILDMLEHPATIFMP